jgi:hypothetical protein
MELNSIIDPGPTDNHFCDWSDKTSSCSQNEPVPNNVYYYGSEAYQVMHKIGAIPSDAWNGDHAK